MKQGDVMEFDTSPELDYAYLRRKYHPLLMEMDRRRVRLHDMKMEDHRLRIVAEAWSADDVNYVWDEARAIDPDLVDIGLEITVGRGSEGHERAADRDISETVKHSRDTIPEQGDRHDERF